jgi:hypothetical protein
MPEISTHLLLPYLLASQVQTLVPQAPGDTVELQGSLRVADGYFATDHTTFWGCKVG